ncbi:uncharacterized protein LOC144162386 [Haemaphysalis longicornis]
MADRPSNQRPVPRWYRAMTAVTTDTWKGQLDFDRACSGPEQRCWLCTELTPWNQVLHCHRLGFELVEHRPGKLRLHRTRWMNAAREWDLETTAKVSFLVSWLLQHHRCIDELKVACCAFAGDWKQEMLFPIRLHPAGRSLRGLEVETYVDRWSCEFFRHAHYELEGLDAVRGLETLKLQLNAVEVKLAAEFARLLRRNAGSIKRLEISHSKLPRQVNNALRCLFSCESLTLHTFSRDPLLSVHSVARLLHSSTALKELGIGTIGSATQMSAIAKELEINTSLTKLTVEMSWQWRCPEAVFTALQCNTTMKELSVTDCHICGECDEALALLLQMNTGLRLLYMRDVYVSGSPLPVLAAALRSNTTLESLHLHQERYHLALNVIVELCNALHVNRTLKKLQFEAKVSPEEPSFRAVLVEQLAQDECYGRVQLPWTEPHLPGLTAALASAFAGFKELHLSDTHCMSEAGLKQLFDVLASNKCVRTLKVCVSGDAGEKGRGLCEMLKVNRSIECLDLDIRDDIKFLEEVLHALAENVGITKIVLTIYEVRELETAAAFSYFGAHNKMATDFCVYFGERLSSKFVEQFSEGFLHNRTILKAKRVQCLYDRKGSFPVYEAVRRNWGALNRAVEFVVSPSLDRQCAEGFEHFSGRPCLLKHLKKVSGKTELEALLAIAAAEYYLRDNYLLITGIAQHSVKCHPSKATQVDALNKHCWLAIVRHLKVADVLT